MRAVAVVNMLSALVMGVDAQCGVTGHTVVRMGTISVVPVHTISVVIDGDRAAGCAVVGGTGTVVVIGKFMRSDKGGILTVVNGLPIGCFRTACHRQSVQALRRDHMPVAIYRTHCQDAVDHL